MVPRAGGMVVNAPLSGMAAQHIAQLDAGGRCYGDVMQTRPVSRLGMFSQRAGRSPRESW